MAIDKHLVLNFQRVRNVKPEFFSHEGLYDMETKYEVPVRTAFIGLWTVCDKSGRFRWQPRQLKAKILPYDVCDFGKVLEALSEIGSVVKYSVGGKDYGYIPSWKKHQYIAPREQSVKSSYPAPNGETDTETVVDPVENGSSTVPEPYRSVSNGNGMEKNGKCMNGNGAGAHSQSQSSHDILSDSGSSSKQSQSSPGTKLARIFYESLKPANQSAAPRTWERLWSEDFEELYKSYDADIIVKVIKFTAATKYAKYCVRAKGFVEMFDEILEAYERSRNLLKTPKKVIPADPLAGVEL